jgi:predicted ATPase
MKIESIHIHNFKSIRDASIKFDDLNILIGKNAAGKSNIFEILQFLKDIGEQNLENAIQLRGGVEYFRNIRIGSDENFELSCSFSQSEQRHGGTVHSEDTDYRLSSVYSTDYKLEIGFFEGGYEVVNEKIVNERTARSTEEGISDGFQIKEILSRDGGEAKRRIETPDGKPDIETRQHSFGILRNNYKLSKKESILSLVGHPRRNFTIGLYGLSDLQIYDIEPSKIKKGTTLKGKRELEQDGENLPLVLKEIVSSEDQKDKFLNIVGDILPFLKDWQTDTLRDKSVFLKILEEFEEKDEEYLPANLVSDGTLNVIALMIILYFENRDINLIEEPEKSIHPSLISKIVDMMEDVSENSDKQIFVTTHNVELIKNVDLDNIFLVSRDKLGFTEINRPENNSHVREFLNQGMGLGEMYINNILEEEI